jgi:hypothetical protein
LGAGTYLIQASQPFYGVNNCKIRLRNTTASTTAIFGESDFASPTVGASATLRGYVVLAGATTLELQYFANTAVATVGLGVSSSSGEGEVFANIQIQQVA